MKKNKILILLALLCIIPMQSFAQDVPAMLVAYKDVVTGIISQVIVGFVIIIMLVLAAYEMKVNGNASPLKWAIFASIIMGSAVYFGPSLVDFAASALNGYNGASATATVADINAS